uniref:Uncharacterized protein n=1 Tax=Plectus sambesii TaxID=2011161 RepID=A0A914W772_9BILA
MTLTNGTMRPAMRNRSPSGRIVISADDWSERRRERERERATASSAIGSRGLMRVCNAETQSANKVLFVIHVFHATNRATPLGQSPKTYFLTARRFSQVHG